MLILSPCGPPPAYVGRLQAPCLHLHKFHNHRSPASAPGIHTGEGNYTHPTYPHHLIFLSASPLSLPSTLLLSPLQAHRAPTEEHGRRIILEAVDEIQAMPDLAHVDFSRVRRLTEEASSAGGGESPSTAA